MTNDRDAPEPDHILTKAELRGAKPGRVEFRKQPRTPITVILDGVMGNYNIGAIFRLCDGFLVERLIICGRATALWNHKLVASAAGTQNWVPWEMAENTITAIQAVKRDGYWIGAAELTANSIPPNAMQPNFPAALVLGGERAGLSPDALALADRAIAIPMLGMANSLNVATTAAIVLHELAQKHAGSNHR